MRMVSTSFQYAVVIAPTSLLNCSQSIEPSIPARKPSRLTAPPYVTMRMICLLSMTLPRIIGFGLGEGFGGRVRLIGLFEPGDFLVGEIYVDGGYGVFEVVVFGGPDNGRRDDGLVEQPGQGDLGWRKIALASNLVYAIDYGFVEIAGLGEKRLGEAVGPGAVGLRFVLRRARQVPIAFMNCQAYMDEAPR